MMNLQFGRRSVIKAAVLGTVLCCASARAGLPWTVDVDWYTYTGELPPIVEPPTPSIPACNGVIFNNLPLAVTAPLGGQAGSNLTLPMTIATEEVFGVSSFVLKLEYSGRFSANESDGLVQVTSDVRIREPNETMEYFYPVRVLDDYFPIEGSYAGTYEGSFRVSETILVPSPFIPAFINSDTIELDVSLSIGARSSEFVASSIELQQVRIVIYPYLLCCQAVDGDANFDGDVTVDDIPAFVDLLLYQDFPDYFGRSHLDMNDDGLFDGRDIQGFVDNYFESCG